jgi:hypothetical protein
MDRHKNSNKVAKTQRKWTQSQKNLIDHIMVTQAHVSLCMWKKIRHTQCENNLRFNGQINTHTHTLGNALRALKIIGLASSTIDDQY